MMRALQVRPGEEAYPKPSIGSNGFTPIGGGPKAER